MTGYSGYIPPPASQLRTGPSGELASTTPPPTTSQTLQSYTHPHQPIGRTTPDIPTITITSSSIHQTIPTTSSTSTTTLNVSSLALVNQTNALKIGKSDTTTTNCEHTDAQHQMHQPVQVCPSGRTHCF